MKNEIKTLRNKKTGWYLHAVQKGDTSNPASAISLTELEAEEWARKAFPEYEVINLADAKEIE